MRYGFSLIELLVVIAIMSIAAALAAPRYGAAVNRYRAEAAARRIAADLRLVQSKARCTSTSRSIVFDSRTSNYTLLGETDLVRPSATYTVDLTADPYWAGLTSVNIPGSGTVSANGVTTLTFNGYGVPASAGSIQLRSGNTTKTISFDADSGAVTVQ
jgi:type II secretion system protein H